MNKFEAIWFPLHVLFDVFRLIIVLLVMPFIFFSMLPVVFNETWFQMKRFSYALHVFFLSRFKCFILYLLEVLVIGSLSESLDIWLFDFVAEKESYV